MKYEGAISRLNSKRNGTFFSCKWQRPLKTRRGVDDVVTKEVTALVRKGINRQNLARFKNGLEEYKPASLPWGKWKEGMEGVIIEHTNTKGETQNYVRLYTTNNKPKVKYFINGNEVPKDRLIEIVPKSELEHEGIIDCFVVNINNITNI